MPHHNVVLYAWQMFALNHWQPRLLQLAAQITDTDTAHDLPHLQRVWATAQALLADYPQANALVVLAACMLHDCVNLPKNHPQRAHASRMAAVKAVAALQAEGFPPEHLTAVAHAIEAHSYSAGITATSIEAQIVQDADRLDALGPVGLARMFSIGGQLGRALAHPTDPLAQHRALDDVTYTLDHIEVKLATLPASMQTPAGRRLGEQRLAWVRSFQQAFTAQWLASGSNVAL